MVHITVCCLHNGYIKYIKKHDGNECDAKFTTCGLLAYTVGCYHSACV